MSGTTESRRGPGGARALARLLLPGTEQIVRGQWGAGLASVTLWVALISTAVWRRGRWIDAWTAGWDQRLSAAGLLAGLAAVWMWGWWSARREPTAGAGEGRLPQVARALAADPPALAGIWVVGAICLVALLAPLISPFDPNVQGSLVAERFLAPSRAHLLGTDNLARDVLSRLLYGARVSLTIGLLAVAVSVTVGTLVGAVAGYLGGWVDAVVMRIVDTFLAFPRLVLLITIVALFDPGMLLVVAVLGLTLWPSTARLVRAEVLALRQRDFILAAEALGFSRRRIVFGHLVPNALGPIIVAATLGIGDTIVLEAGLSFLGLGVQAPTASWGSMVDAGRANLLGAWWIATFPGLAIVGTVLAFNLVGDGLRDALDPRFRA